jgi:diaminopimelate decarboxylase
VTRPVIAAFGSDGGVLTVGGITIDRLAERVGRTPFFAYDRALISARVESLRSVLPPDLELSYAIKANPMPAVVQHLSHIVDSFDVASGLEMQTALDTPMPANRVSFAGPGKTPEELTQAIAAGVTVEIESENEADSVIAIGERSGIRPRVAVRVNPDFQIVGSGVRLGGGPQQFGIDSERVPAVVERLTAGYVEFLGFHVFAGSQNLHAELIAEAQEKTVRLLLDLARDVAVPIRYLNLGGGFGIPYFERDQPLDIGRIGTALKVLLADSIRSALPDARVVIELGRYLVGEAGVYVTRVIDVKESRGRTFAVVDGGLHHQLSASGNFGQVIRRNYPLAVGNRLDEASEETVTVVGCLCTPLDLLGDEVLLPKIQIGDLVVVFQAGAYGLTASPTSFLSHPPAPEILV